LAGAYQSTPLKYHCLDKCRSPFSFIMEHWTGKNQLSQAFRLGLHHGIFCIGCWSLMLLMFAVGTGNIGWMLVLGALMAVEKNLPWGRRMSKPLDILLLTCGIMLVVSAHFFAL
jgi:predicted metal-binding membrane protein